MPRHALPCLLLLLLFAAAPAQAGIFLRLAGAGQGDIIGDAPSPYRDFIELNSFSQSSTYEVDPNTGLPTDKRIVGPLEFDKRLDGATIPMIAAMVEREDLTTFEIEATRLGQNGHEPYLRVTLINAAFMEDSYSADGFGNVYKDYAVAFQRIRWHDLITNEIYEEDMGTTSTGPGAGGLARLNSVPNPTSGPTKFHFQLPAASHVTLDIYDARGRRVARVFEGQPAREEATVSWNGRDDQGRPVASGIYAVHMQAGEWLTTQKLAVLR